MDKTLFIIDRETYKIMKYIYRHKEVTISKLMRKFKNFDDVDAIAIALCKSKYAAYRDTDNSLHFDVFSYSDRGSVGLTPLGNKYIQDKRLSFIQWFVPVMCSIISVFVSILALIISLINANNELFIHLIQ